MRSSIILCCVAAAFPGPADAAGFLIAEQGARATGLADAMTASPGDGSAIWYNPAGVATLDGLQLSLGGNLILPDASFDYGRSGQVTDARAQSFFTPALFLTYAVNEQLSVGIGCYSPFGLGIAWPEGWVGRSVVTRADLQTVFISPVVAAELGPWAPGLAVAAGVDLVPATVTLRRDVLFSDTVANVRLAGEAVGVGGRVGLRYAPPAAPGLALGLAWRSPVELAFSGQGDIDAPASVRAELPADGDVATAVTLPHSLSFGVSYDPIRPLTIAIDIDWMGWSSYDELAIDFPGDVTVTNPKDWRDTVALRLGGEYRFDGFAVRGGYAFDPTPVPRRRLDATLPDGDRHVASLGFGATMGFGISVDAGLLWVLPFARNTAPRLYEPELKGTYEASAWVASLSLRWAWAGGRATAAPAAPPPAPEPPASPDPEVPPTVPEPEATPEPTAAPPVPAPTLETPPAAEPSSLGEPAPAAPPVEGSATP